MLKRIACALFALLMMCSPVYAYNVVNLPDSMTFAEASGIYSYSDVSSATVCDIDRNIIKNLSSREIEEFCEKALNMTVWRKINPTPFRGACVNFSGKNGNKISYYLNAGIQIGTYGSENFVCYMTTAEDTAKLNYIAEELYDMGDKAVGGADWTVVSNRDFLKLPNHDWAKETVADAAAKSLVPYDFTDKYANNITREEFAILLCNYIAVAGNYVNIDAYMSATGTSYGKGSFKDCTGRDEAIDCLYALGIISGVDGVNFNPDGYVTRREAAAFVCRAAKLFMYVNTTSNTKTADWQSVGSWAEFYMKWCMDKGLFLVDDKNMIYPANKITVEQTVTVLSRLYDITGYWES